MTLEEKIGQILLARVPNVNQIDDLVEQMRSEVIGSFQNVLNELNNPDNTEGIAGTFVDTVKAGLAGLGDKTVKQYGEGEIEEKKSRFLGKVKPVETEEEAIAFIESIKKQYWDARHNCYAFIIGEHGDSEIAAWSSANVSGIPINDFCEMRGHYQHEKSTQEIAEAVKNSAYNIIQRKHATYYGVAMAVKRICEVIVRDEKSILPVSALMEGEHGIEDVVLRMPCVVGKDGIETKVPFKLNEEEEQKLLYSANVLKEIISTIEL